MKLLNQFYTLGSDYYKNQLIKDINN